SVSLFYVLHFIRRDLDITLVAAHLDHGIRVERESKADADFSRNLAKNLGHPFAYKKLKLGAKGKEGRSIEEIARYERYKFFVESAEKHKCNVIATAHNLDDHAETVLMRIIKGTSVEGLRGIPPVRYEGPYKVIRPLIRCEKSEILCFLGAIDAEFCVDKTNSDKKYLRNRIRSEVLPFLEKINPKVRRALINLSDSSGEDSILGGNSASEVILKKGPGGAPHVKFNINDIMLTPRSTRKNIFKAAILALRGDVKKLTYRHWMDIDLLLRSDNKNSSLDLPGHITLERVHETLTMSKKQ
ncbi:MAG: tRNA lysidine(34) synthetase TilS, partial [Candidatus Omnitrophica bacterium]|nr:tRNA lysidine(34) synthetase TilS [Candidatus Omnitrophota bacterium]